MEGKMILEGITFYFDTSEIEFTNDIWKQLERVVKHSKERGFDNYTLYIDPKQGLIAY